VQHEKGGGAGKQTLDGVDPDLLQLIGTLTADQQQSFLKVLSKASAGPPKKGSRQQDKQPAAGSLNTAPRPSKKQRIQPAPKAESDGEHAKDAGAVEPHLQRDAIPKAFNSAHLIIPANQTKRTTRSCDQPILSCLQYLNGAALLPLECFRVDSLTSLSHCTITCAKLKCQSKAYVLINLKHPFPQIEGQLHRIMAGIRRLGFAARYCCLPRRPFSMQSKNNASRAS
jgi:hypothetical protein